MHSIIKKTIDTYEMDNRSTTHYLHTFLQETVSTYDFMDAGYVGIVCGDMWLVHSTVNTDFSTLLMPPAKKSPMGIPVFTDATIIEGFKDHYYDIRDIADFYSPLDAEKINIIRKIHKDFNRFIIIPMTYKTCVMGHLMLCVHENTSKEQVQDLMTTLEVAVKLMASYLHNSKLDDMSYAYKGIVETTNAVSSTNRLTGYIHKSFISTLMKLALNLIPEADYGSSVIINNGLWMFDDSVGHDVEALKSLPISRELYLTNEQLIRQSKKLGHNIYLIKDILWHEIESRENTNFIRKMIREKSKPIKSSLQVHISNSGALKGLITLDIAPNNPLEFSSNSVEILKQIGNMASLFFSYNTLYGYSESFNKLTKLISSYSFNRSDQDTFAKHFLSLMVEGIPEANFASIYIRSKGKIHYIDAVGHDIDTLRQLDIDAAYFSDPEPEKNDRHILTPFTIYRNIQETSVNKMPQKLQKQFIDATRASKESMICHFQLNEDTIMDIAIDIGEGSLLSFSNESIITFQSYANVGFAFIAQQRFYHAEEQPANEDMLDIRDTDFDDDVHAILSTVDELTGLYNHTFIITLLKEMMKNAKESHEPISIAMYDIDYFKSINDIHSHITGDHVLMSVSRLIQKTHLKHYAGRYGGEEFLVIMPGYDLEQARQSAEHLRKQIETTAFDQDLKLTISGGVVQWQAESETELIHKADKLLRTAKTNGRNRIE